MLSLKWLLIEIPFLLFFIVLVRYIVLHARLAISSGRFRETPEEYRRDMHYLESLVFHVAFREGTVSRTRIWELVPGASNCPACNKHLQLIFYFGSMRGDLIPDQQAGVYRISSHVTQMVASAESFRDLGQAWVLPVSEIVFEHQAYHAERSL